jgi:hypothetical protein
MPSNLQTLTIKLDFKDSVIDEYYSAHLAAEALASASLRQMNIEVEQLSQLQIFSPSMTRLSHICPHVVHLGLRSRGQNAVQDINKDYWPLENFKLGFDKLKRLKLHKIPIRPIEFKGLVGF